MKASMYENGQWVDLNHDGHVVIEIGDQRFVIREHDGQMHLASSHYSPKISAPSQHSVLIDARR
jgi:hypothetical protein